MQNLHISSCLQQIRKFLNVNISEVYKKSGLSPMEFRYKTASFYMRHFANLYPSFTESTATSLGFSASYFLTFDVYNGKIFKFGEDFAHALNGVSIDIAPRHINFNDFTACIIIPKSLAAKLGADQDQDTFYVSCNLIPPELKEKFDHAKYRIDIHIPSTNNRGDADFMMSIFNVSFDEGDIISKQIDYHLNQEGDDQDHKMFGNIGNFIAKALLYINSGDPDLRDLRPIRNSRSLRAFKRSGENSYDLPVTLVGFDYKKPKIYNVSETFVQTHPRWQPCGPNREKIKLVWVKEHVRHYRQAPVVTSPEAQI